MRAAYQAEKNSTSWPSSECTRQQQFLATRWELNPHLRRKQSTSGRQEVCAGQEIYFSQHEKSQCDLKAIIADVGQEGHCHVDPPVNVKAASNGEFNVRESAAEEYCTGTFNKPTAETTGRQRLDGLSKRLNFGKLHDVVKCMTE